MKYSKVVLILMVLFYSCSMGKMKQPQKAFESVPDKITLNKTTQNDSGSSKMYGLLTIDSLKNASFLSNCDSIIVYLDMYNSNGKKQNLLQGIDLWRNAKKYLESDSLKINHRSMQPALTKWFALTTELLKVTGNPVYADQLEGLNVHLIDPELLKHVVYTMDTDNIYVNLFEPSALSFGHSLGGSVEIEQQVELSAHKYVQLQLKMEIKRYMEVYIRIPSWAEGAEVEVKKVKYLAIPGSYCKIAKKWKEGDIIDIRLPMKQG